MAANSRRTIPRLAVYGLTTTVLTVGVVASAFTLHDHFYTGCVLLSQSGAAMMILANMGLLLTILLGKLLVRIFLGQLRAIEVERLYEQSWLAVTETCLALAILRDEFDAATLTLFVFLLFCKLFHWMLADRVTFMEQQTRLTVLFLVRITALSVLLFSVDCLMLSYAVGNTRRYGATMMIVFGFEYALLLARFMATSAKFVLNAIDLARGGEWEDKQTLVFYVELAYDLARLVVYLFFFAAVMAYYGPPIHILRDLYITARSFYNRCRDWVRYRKAMRNMHLRYPTVSQDELNSMSDTTCIICRDEMTGPSQEQADIWNNERRAGLAQNLSGDTPKRLPCSHVFHFNCLRSWLERQQSCPTCRHSVLDDTVPAEGSRNAPPARNPPPPPHDLPQGNIAATDATRRQAEDLHQPRNHIPPSAMSNSAPANNAAPSNAVPMSGRHSHTPTLQCQSTTTRLPLTGEQGYGAGATAMPEMSSLMSIFPPTATHGPLLVRSLQDFPAPDLTTLSDEQIKALESGSRAAVEERIRILSAFQVQISHMVVALTQVQSLSSARATSTTSHQTDSALPADPRGASPVPAISESNGEGSSQQQEQQQVKGKEPDI
ncbi:E3 ubiquitin-protein ligase hrd1 [Coemansia aciculifera]|uniref:RING-type E3 ubiquitin transferase n=1 Tax=Coemansia aciculifera TaxID=417176 RepID=A0A9W8M608_9FUNG|nr:E3 ubiquitin-protein ligase hrd1 [Coemansia aciculifera]